MKLFSKILLLSAAFFPLAANAIAELDTLETEALPKTAPPIQRQQNKPKKVPVAKDEKEILSFTIPPAVAGNVIPHIPTTPPQLPNAQLYFQSRSYFSGYKPAIAWRIKARSLFEKSAQISKTFESDSKSVFETILKESGEAGLFPVGLSFAARQMMIELNDNGKKRYAVIALKDVQTQSKQSILKANILPYKTQASLSKLRLFLDRVQYKLAQKDIF